MRPAMGFFVILLIVLLVVIGFVQLMLPSLFPDRRRARPFCLGLLFFDLLAAGGLFFGRALALPEGAVRAAMEFISMAFMFQLLLAGFILLARLVRWGYRRLKAVPLDPSRRRMLTHAAAYPLAAAAAAVYGGVDERVHQVVREHLVPIAGQATGLEGFRIAQLSDVHLGLFFSLPMLRELLEQAAGLGADALVITGDLFDDDALNVGAAQLVNSYVGRFPRGIWFCYGNHEYFRNIARTNAALAATQIHVLADANALVQAGGRPLYFAGVDYPRSRKDFDALAEQGTAQALQGIPTNAVTVLLAHHPDFIDLGAAKGAALVLTGHTHGGQLGLFGVPLVPPVFKYMRGLYRVGAALGYVHSGNGSWFPYRLGCPPEIACFTLREERA